MSFDFQEGDKWVSLTSNQTGASLNSLHVSILSSLVLLSMSALFLLKFCLVRSLIFVLIFMEATACFIYLSFLSSSVATISCNEIVTYLTISVLEGTIGILLSFNLLKKGHSLNEWVGN